MLASIKQSSKGVEARMNENESRDQNSICPREFLQMRDLEGKWGMQFKEEYYGELE